MNCAETHPGSRNHNVQAGASRGSLWALAVGAVLLGAAVRSGAQGGAAAPQFSGGGLVALDRVTPADQEYQMAALAAQKNPKDAALALEAGGIAGDRGRSILALRWFRRAEALDGKLVPAITGQGQMWLRLGWPRQAAGALERARRLAPREPQILLELARACAEYRDLDRALQAVREAEKLQPSDPHVMRALATVYGDLMDFDRSLEYAQKACDLGPSDPVNWTTLGQFLIGRNRHADALAPLRRALKLNPAEPTANLMLAQALLGPKKTAAADREAFAALSRVRLRESGNAQALYLQGEITLRRGLVPLAISLLSQAREASPRDPLVLRALGQALGRAGRMQEGLRLTNQSQQLGPRGVVFSDLEHGAREDKDSASTVTLGEVYRRQERLDAAAFVLERGLKRFPGDVRLRKKLDQVRAELKSRFPTGLDQ